MDPDANIAVGEVMPVPEAQRDFFISYRSSDESWATWLAWQLEDAGYKTFLQAWDFRPGYNWVEEMQRGTIGCARTLAVLTPAYFESGFARAEWYTAFAHDPTGEQGLLLPVRVAECDIKGLLGQVIYVNLVGLDEAAARERLLAGVNRSRAKPSVQPSWPPGKKPPFPGTPSDAPQPSPRPSDPYPGLRAFTSDQADFFFGREHETDELIARLRTGCGFLTIVGASGIGRSSLVYAGLLPRLAEGAIEGSAKWPVVSFKPGSQGDYPFLALANVLKPLLPPGSVGEPIDLANALRRDPVTIADFINKTLTNAPTSAQLVLFVDQLEELFTQAKEDYREGFVDLLSKAARHRRVRVLATLRADFRPQADKYAELDTLLQAGTFELKPAGHQALTRMIRGPAERVGMKLEDELVDKILEDAGRNAGALPLVAFCLRELYEKCKSAGRMTLKVYSEELGGLFTAIGKHADNLLVEWEDKTELEKNERANVDTALETIFWALVTVDPDEKVFRRRATPEEFGENAAVIELIEELKNGRLLICTNSSDGSSECPTVELAHEALLDKWTRLKNWIEQNRSEMVLWARLKRHAGRWLQKHDNSLLWRGNQLRKAKKFLECRSSYLSRRDVADGKRFVKASTIRRWTVIFFIPFIGVIGAACSALFIYLATTGGSGVKAMPVGSFESNQFSLYDVIGNVWEWTNDCLNHSKDDSLRCARGGSWDNYEEPRTLPSFRLELGKSNQAETIGFRVARELNDAERELDRDCPEDLICPKMVILPGGWFVARALPSGAKSCKEELPQPPVLIEPFAIGQYEVTVAEWNECVTDKYGDCKEQFSDANERWPVTDVSWVDAQQYVKWLSSKTNQTYRLPYDAEWEYAARGNTKTCWPWGDEIGIGNANCAACGVTSK